MRDEERNASATSPRGIDRKITAEQLETPAYTGQPKSSRVGERLHRRDAMQKAKACIGHLHDGVAFLVKYTDRGMIDASVLDHI